MPTLEGLVWVMGGLQRESAAGDVACEGAVGVGVGAVGSVIGVASGGTGVGDAGVVDGEGVAGGSVGGRVTGGADGDRAAGCVDFEGAASCGGGAGVRYWWCNGPGGGEARGAVVRVASSAAGDGGLQVV